MMRDTRIGTPSLLGRVCGLLLAVVILSASVGPRAADAQLPPASASTLALAGNHTALATGFGSLAINPAGLAAPEASFGLALAPVLVRGELGPIGLPDLYDWQNRRIPDATKEDWLQRVEAAGGQRLKGDVEVSGFSLAFAGIGLQISSVVAGDARIPSPIFEAMLFGNAGRTGAPTDLSLVDTRVRSFAATTMAAGLGIPMSRSFGIGATLKYTQGHALAVGRTANGTIRADPITASVDFGMITSCLDEIECSLDRVDAGSGTGLDLGARWDLGTLTLAASFQNVFNTFAWEEEKLAYRPGTVLVEAGSGTADFDERPFDEAPADLKQVVADLGFGPAYRLGAALDVGSRLTLVSDVQRVLGNSATSLLRPAWQVGAGAELRMPFLQLRAGMAKLSGGSQYSGGASIVLGPVNLSAAGGIRRIERRDTGIVQFVLSFGDR